MILKFGTVSINYLLNPWMLKKLIPKVLREMHSLHFQVHASQKMRAFTFWSSVPNIQQTASFGVNLKCVLSTLFPVFLFPILVNSVSDITRDYFVLWNNLTLKMELGQKLKFHNAENYHKAVKVCINGKETRRTIRWKGEVLVHSWYIFIFLT